MRCDATFPSASAAASATSQSSCARYAVSAGTSALALLALRTLSVVLGHKRKQHLRYSAIPVSYTR